MYSHIDELEDQVEQYEKERLEACEEAARLEEKIECLTAEYNHVEVNITSFT